jgi:DNA invertase Pin-like site-specific DNA recombinase
MEAVASGEIEYVVAWQQDRLWRDVADQQAFLALGRRAGLKAVVTMTNEFDPSDADDEYVSTLLAANAKRESAMTSKRIRRSILDRAERGAPHGGRRGFGYDRAHKIVKSEAKLIREAVTRTLNGESTGSIVADWKVRGVQTPSGGSFSTGTLSRLLRQARLAGLREHLGATYPGTWEPIITVEEHETLRRLIDARQRGPSAPRTTKWLLSGGILQCGKCGGSLRAQKANARHYTDRYACPDAGVGGCGGISVNADKVEERVRDLVLDELNSARFAKRVERERKQQQGADDVVTKLIDALTRDRAKLVAIGDAYADTDMDRATYVRQVDRINARIAETERKLDTVSTAHSALRYAGRAAELRADWEEMTVPERQTLIRTLATSFTITPGERGAFDQDRVVPNWR